MAAKKSAVPSFEVKIGGKAMNKAERLDVQEVVVDNLSDGPDMAHVKLNAHEGDERGLGVWLERSEIKIGNPIEVSLSFYPETPKLVFKGEIIGWEPSVIGKEPAGVVIRGFNKLHRLSRGKKSRPWQDVSLSDIAKEIAGDWKLGTKGVKATSPVQPGARSHDSMWRSSATTVPVFTETRPPLTSSTRFDQAGSCPTNMRRSASFPCRAAIWRASSGPAP